MYFIFITAIIICAKDMVCGNATAKINTTIIHNDVSVHSVMYERQNRNVLGSGMGYQLDALSQKKQQCSDLNCLDDKTFYNVTLGLLGGYLMMLVIRVIYGIRYHKKLYTKNTCYLLGYFAIGIPCKMITHGVVKPTNQFYTSCSSNVMPIRKSRSTNARLININSPPATRSNNVLLGDLPTTNNTFNGDK